MPIPEESRRIRVLFVDDERLVLQGLQRMLRPMRTQWEMDFVESGEQALALLRERPCQAVVSDMRMPGMNGAALLAQVKDLYPNTVRLILSGHADKELIMKCVGTAHQFLSKPCEPETLRMAIGRASAFDLLLKSDRMKRLIGQMDCLPSIPSLLNDMMDKLQDENCSLEDIAQIIRQDIAMTAKLLKLVNSAFFGLRRQISNPSEAISHLGLETIKSLVLTLEVFSAFEGKPPGPIALEELWGHSLQVANLAKTLAIDCHAEKRIVDDSFVGGILHDIGKLVLSSNLPGDYSQVFASAAKSGQPLATAEEALFGANHGDVGGYLLSLWGLPGPVVDAIACHHSPERNPEKSFNAAAAVYVANFLCRETEAPGYHSQLNMEYLRSLGLGEKIQLWRSNGWK